MDDISVNSPNNDIKKYLRKFGRLPSDFDGDVFIPFLNHENDEIRLLAIKNLGKLKDVKYLYIAKCVWQNDKDSMVRREAVSTIGRMKCEEIIPVLLEILNDDDPKIVLQAIRGLLPFKKRDDVSKAFNEISNHPNEVVQQVIRIETAPPMRYQYDAIGFPDYLNNVVVNDDVLEVLKEVPEESVHLTFTSPPYYNARDYSIYKSYDEYINFLSDVFKEVHRITKEGRFFILNTSPVILPRAGRKYSSKRYAIPFDMHTKLIEMGWEFIDDIIWVKPEGAAKNRVGGFLQHRKPLAYKPNMVSEYLLVYRKKTDRLIDWNMKQYDSDIIEKSKVLGDVDNSNVWYISPDNDAVHSAVFPEELCEKVIKYYSYEGDLVFDPFAGSGTFGRTALKMERSFFMTEIQEDYFKRIKEKMADVPLSLLKKPEFYSLSKFKEVIQNE